MRILLWMTLGFGTACGLWSYVFNGTVGWKTGGVVLLFAVLSAIPARKIKGLARVAILAFGLSLGFFWCFGYQCVYLEPLHALDGTTTHAVLRTCDYSQQTRYGTCVEAVTEIKGRSYLTRVYLDETEVLSPGTILEGDFRYQFTGPEGESRNDLLSGKGICLIASQTDRISLRENPPETLQERSSVIRRRIQSGLSQTFPEDTVAFAKALLLGDTSELSYQTDTDLKITGIRHVAAVSGLHVSILFALLTRLTFRRRYWTALLGMPVLLLFASVAGFSPSVNRSCLMCGLMLLGLLVDREYDGATALSFSVLVMLAVNPVAVTSVSFQLSVASVTGIFLCQSRIAAWIKEKLGEQTRIPGWMVSSVATSLSATLLTTPLCAWYFGMVSLIGVLTNLLTLWVISFVFYGIMAVAALAMFWRAGAVLLAGMISLPIRCVLLTAGILADFPLAAVYTTSVYVVFWLFFVYFLLGVFLLSREKKPVLLVCCGAVGLCAALLASWVEPTQDTARMTVLDVGQGQCILLQSGGKTYMVDCGGDGDTSSADIAAEALLSQGIHTLDGLILTHTDRDHAGGAVHLLTRIKTELLLLPEAPADPALTTGQNVLCVTEDLDLQWEDARIRIFSSDFPGNGNENSLCILFDTEKCDILITGDRTAFGERMLLRFHEVPDVDVLIAGHHGSGGSTCRELLEAVRPEIVCVSVGADNFYGHPSPQLLERLADFGCTVYRTDESGTILIRS